MVWILFFFSIITGSLQQLQIEVTRPGFANDSNEGVLASYTHPEGLTLDWWSITYINIPQTGIKGVLLYQPVLCLTNFTLLPKVPENCKSRNFSLILLTPHLLNCPKLILRYAKENGYSGIITYGDNSLTIENAVNDPSSESLVYLQPTNLFFAVVSEKFATELHGLAISICNRTSYLLTTVSLGSTNVTGAKFGVSLFMVVVMLFSLFLFIAGLNGTLKYCKRQSSGFYDVQNVQLREMNFSIPVEARERTARALYSKKSMKFDDSMKNEINSTCPICLDSFSDGDDVCVLACEGGHAFHSRCIGKWLTTQNTCPVCRNLLRAHL